MEIAVNVTPVVTNCLCQQYEAFCRCGRKLPRLASFGKLKRDYIRCSSCGKENEVRRPHK